MGIRFYNARILTPLPAGIGVRLLEGELHTEGDRITYVGETDANTGRDACFDRELDCKGNLLLPGFKNAHAHGPMTFLRSYADDEPLDKWLSDKVFPAEAKLTEEDTYWLHKLAILEYLSGGITSSFEMYFIDEGIARASLDMGFRTVFCGALVGAAPAWLDRLKNRYEAVNADTSGLLSYQIGFHAEYSTSVELLAGVAELAHTYQAPVYTHCQETKKETEACKAQCGKTPLKKFVDMGLFDYGGGVYHMVWPDEEDYSLLKEYRIGVVTNPGSNAKLASGIAPVSEYIRRGIPVGIGTDGPASNNGLDMFWELHLASACQKLKNEDAAALPALCLLDMATSVGARIMRLPDCDALSIGKKADILMIDMQQPNMQPILNPLRNLVYSGSKQNVKLTMVNGEILYENGAYPERFGVEEVYRKAGEICARIHGASF